MGVISNYLATPAIHCNNLGCDMKSLWLKRHGLLDSSSRISPLRLLIAIVALTNASLSTTWGASAVAVATDARSGEPRYGYWHGSTSETEARNRAIRFSLEDGGKNAKVIASTSLRGYGAIVFYTYQGKSKFVASVGARSVQAAVSAAFRESYLRGAKSGRVVQVWNDT